MRHNFNVTDSTDVIMEVLGLDEDKRDLISTQFRKISPNLKKSQKSPESLSTDEWWSTEIPWQPSQQTTPVKSSLRNDMPKAFRKNYFVALSHSTAKRFESVLNCIRTVAKTEETSLITIVSLAMQLLANDVDNREIAFKRRDYFGNVARRAFCDE